MLYYYKGKRVKSSMTRSHPVENILPMNLGSIINYLAVMLLKEPNVLLPVAVDHSKQWPMASEMVDIIDGPLPPTLHIAVPPELHLHDTMRASNHKTCCSQWDANTRPSKCQANALSMLLLRVFKSTLTG